MSIKIVMAGLLMALTGAIVPVGYAQDTTPPAVAVPVNPEIRSLAAALIEESLQAAHVADIYANLRRTLRETYIPAMRDLVQGDFPGVPAPDAKTAAAMAKVLTFMDYVRKAGDELDVALSENRAAMISDAAGEIAKSAQPPELNDVRDILRLPAVRKTFDAFYAMTKLVTGFSYEDTRTFADFSAWAQSFDFDISQAVPGAAAPPRTVPSTKKIAKAQALMSDLIQLSHLDEMVADVKRFVREVYAEIAPMPDEARQELREQADQLEFTYSMQKAMAVAVAPSIVAAALSDEQLATLHGFVRSRAFGNAFDSFRNVVKSATAFTKEDILEAQKSFEDIERKSKLRERGQEEQDKARTAWNALIKKWTGFLKDRISPETRSGLERSLQDLQDNGAPI
jgi:hypothetical protein